MNAPQKDHGDPGLTADLAVSAQRTFTAALRAARATRLPHAQALRAANDYTVRMLGFDWLAELGLAAEVAELAPACEPASIATRTESTVSEFVEALVSGALAPLRLMPGMTSSWYSAYVDWCDRSGRSQVSLKRFVHELDDAYGFRAERKRVLRDGLRTHPLSFLYFNTQPPRGRVESEWLGEQVVLAQAMFDAAGVRKH